MSNYLKKTQDKTQQRLEKIWFLLRMSDEAKLDMAIKYCTSNYANKINEVSSIFDNSLRFKKCKKVKSSDQNLVLKKEF